MGDENQNLCKNLKTKKLRKEYKNKSSTSKHVLSVIFQFILMNFIFDRC